MPNTDTPELVTELEGTDFPLLSSGSYLAELLKIERITTKFGPAFKWYWRVDGVAEDGGDFLLTDVTSTMLSPKSRANGIVRALRGSVLTRGEKLDLEAMPRQAQLIVSVNEETGFNNIEKVLPAPRPPVSPAHVPDPDIQRHLAQMAAEQAAIAAANAEEPPPPAEPRLVSELSGA